MFSELFAGQAVWVLKGNVSLEAVVNFAVDNEKYDRPWIINYKKNSNKNKKTQPTPR
jgi:hypothetical protein